MKRILFFAALVLGMVSCMKDQSFDADLAGDGNFVVSVALPDDATRAAGVDSSKGAIANNVLNEYDIRYTLEVYDAYGALAKEDQKTVDATSTSFELRLIPGRHYRFVVWADFVKGGVAYYDVDDLRDVKIIGEHNAMNESRDAYTAVYNTKTEGEGKEFSSASKIEMTLTRPFAKLRVVTNDMKELYADLKSATVKYKTPIYTGFNALNAEVTGATESNVEKSVDFTNAAYKYDGESTTEGEQTLFADYIFGAEGDVVMFTLDVEDAVAAIPTVTFNTNIPVQRNHLTTIYGPVLTDANNISVEIKDAFDEPKNIVTYPIEDANTLAAVLTSNEKHINATLGRDIDLPISSLGAQTPGSGEYKLGGEATETINIDLNGHKLNITTTYWSSLGAKNENALFTIKNGTMTSSQPTGTWNSYDLTFANCNYVFEDVVFDKAIALSNVGEAVTRAEATIARKSVTMKNVTINETHDYYAMWITAEGQTVNIEGLTINSLGRGIKIDEQYVDAPAKVTLNINGADFNTKKKAAIMVKSAAGADITLSNVDITGAYDKANAVWVDEDAKAHADKVTVTGGSKAVEGQSVIVADKPEDFANAISEVENGGTIMISSEVTMPYFNGKEINFVGTNENAIVKQSAADHLSTEYEGATLNFVNVTLVGEAYKNNTQGYQKAAKETYKNCHFVNYIMFAGDETTVTDCTFENEGQYFWTGTADNITFTRCKFNGLERAVKVCTVGNAGTRVATFNECEFKAETQVKAAIEIDGSKGSSYTVNINNCTESGFAKGANTGLSLFNVEGAEHVTVVVDGNTWLGNGLYENENGDKVAYSEAGLKEALKNGDNIILDNPFTIDQSESNGYGKTGINMTNGGTIDGNGNELGAPGSTGTWDSAINTSGGTIKNIKVTKGFRGIFIKKDANHNEKLFLDNVIIDGTTYTISCDSGNGLGLEATNCTFKGWTSFAKTLGNAKFTGCTFGAGNGYNYSRPYAPTEYVNCAFEAGHKVDARNTVTFENCTFNGVALTAENLASLVTSNIANASVK